MKKLYIIPNIDYNLDVNYKPTLENISSFSFMLTNIITSLISPFLNLIILAELIFLQVTDLIRNG